MRHVLLIIPVVLLQVSLSEGYDPNWKSLDSRPIPSWYDEAKFGIFVHWGPYSVPGVVSEWFWFYWNRNDPNQQTDVEANNYMSAHFSPDFTYQDFGPQFQANFFNASEWVDIVASSGAKYFVFTTKHHDGFANWPNARSFGWNSHDIGPKRDIVGELEKSFKSDGRVKFGLYHSMFEWFHPLYLQDAASNFTVDDFVKTKMTPELTDLIMKYKPDILWSDGDAGPVDYWESLQFLAWLYTSSPVSETVVTNDRWGHGVQCKHGDFFTCADRYNPHSLQNHKWENALTLDRKSWGYRRNMKLSDVLTMGEIIENLVSTVSCGGNMLLNVGPSSDGVIPVIFRQRLITLGHWLNVNGEAIYSSSPWKCQNDTITDNVWYTTNIKSKNVYAILLSRLEINPDSWVILGCVTPPKTKKMKITILEQQEDVLLWKQLYYKKTKSMVTAVKLPRGHSRQGFLAEVLRISFTGVP